MIDYYMLIKIIPVIISAVSVYYTRTVDKREEKRYKESLRKDLRYEALLFSRQIMMILQKYSLEYDLIEFNSRIFNDNIDEKSFMHFHIDDLPKVIGTKSNVEPVTYFDIYSYKDFINEFTKVEIEKLEDLFRLIGSIDEGKNDLKNKYSLILDESGESIELNSDIVKSYLKTFGIVRSGYNFTFKLIFEEESDIYISIFQKIDKLTEITEDESYYSIIFQYKLVKDKFLNHNEHLDKIEKKMEEEMHT